MLVYTLEDLNPHLSVKNKNQKVYPFLDYVNFDFTDSSKPVEFELLLDK